MTPEIIEAIQTQVKETITTEGLKNGLSTSEIESAITKKISQIGGQLADKASACQNMAFALGSAIAPVLGGKFEDEYGF